MQYNINNFYLDGNQIVINGWAVTDGHQHLTGDNTHEYSLVLSNVNGSDSKVYQGLLKNVDKTRLMKSSHQTVICNTNYSSNDCYYIYSEVGFEFRIPVSDLKVDAEYNIKLRMYEKTVDRGLQQSIYALGVNNSYEKDGVRYQLYSDINKASVKVTSNRLIVRSGPGQNFSQKRAPFSCSTSGNKLYWYPFGMFSNILDVGHTNKGDIASELWLNLGYNYGSCIYGRARAIDGNNYNGWAPWVYMIGGGTPATIKTFSLGFLTIDELRAYTVEKNTIAKALLTLTSPTDREVTIKAYHNNNLVYENVENIDGTETININYIISEAGILKVEVTTRNKSESITSNIYVSSEMEYEIDSTNEDKIIEVETPVLVVTDKNRVATEYREKLMLSAIPYELELTQGRGISGFSSAISYWYPLDEFSLNEDYQVYGLYPSQEETLSYQIVDGKVKVDLEKDKISRIEDYDISFFYHPNILLSAINGELYSDRIENNKYYNGGNIWYPSWNDELGTYDYEYIGTNLGINKITIKRDLTYSITSTMFGNENGKFIIKRIENPEQLNIIYENTFSFDELINYFEEEE